MASKILVLDDEEPILRMLKRRFTAYFFEVDAVRREEEAKRLIAKQTYSVVILDLGLSFLDHTGGLDLIRYIQRRSPGTGIVVYTANDDPKVEDLARQLGADSFVLKPAPLSVLDTIVFKFCKQDVVVKA